MTATTSNSETVVPPLSLVDLEVERRVQAFLYLEAELLHARRFRVWYELLADDLVYRVPVRTTRPEGQGDEHSDAMFHFDETRRTLEMRIERFEGGAAWAENPASRCRYFVTNVRVEPSAESHAYEVRSNLQVARLRADEPDYQFLTGERRDRLRERGDSFVLAQRTVLLDNTTLPMHNLALFL